MENNKQPMTYGLHYNELVEKGWEYIVKVTGDGSWSKKEYLEALRNKDENTTYRGDGGGVR